jgi:hypothetical protein
MYVFVYVSGWQPEGQANDINNLVGVPRDRPAIGQQKLFVFR